MNDDMREIIQRILKDIRVEMGDEFNWNFERQTFFSGAWQRWRSPTRLDSSTPIDSGNLRRSTRNRTMEDSAAFYADSPYAAIHNDGGEIAAAKHMKGYFWHKYTALAGVLQWVRRKDGTMHRDKQTRQQSIEVELRKFMALKKEDNMIKVPRWQFLGTSPEVEQAVQKIIEENITEHFNVDFDIRRK